MAIKKDFETPATGAVASYHYAAMITLDRISKITSIALYSYLSADAFAAKKAPMYTQQIAVTGLPDAGVDPYAYADQQLVAEAPSADAVALNPTRYAFAGAQLVT